MPDICRKPRSGVSCLCLVGPFLMLLMLAFSPVSLTAAEAELPARLTPFWQTILSAASMAAICLIMSLCAGRVRSVTVRKALVVYSMAAPLLSLPLISLVINPIVPTIVALLLSTSSMLQLYYGAHVCSRIGSRNMTVWVSVSLLIAVLFSAVASECMDTAQYGTFLVACVISVCGIALMAMVVRGDLIDASASDAPERRSENMDGHAHGDVAADPPMPADPQTPVDPPTPPSGLHEMFHNDWQALLGGVICAFAMGVAWMNPASPSPVISLVLIIGKLVAASALVIVFIVIGPRLASDTFNYFLSSAAIIGILAWSIGGPAFSNDVLFMFVGCSQVLFIGLLWIETLLTGQEDRDPGRLTSMGVCLFLVSTLTGAFMALVIPDAAFKIIVPVSLLVYLGAILVSALRRSARPAAELKQTMTYDSLLLSICSQLSEEYMLSRREAEILPFLVLGYSSQSIGDRLFISSQTVKSHSHRIYTKMDIHSHDELLELFDRHSDKNS